MTIICRIINNAEDLTFKIDKFIDKVNQAQFGMLEV